MAEHGDGAIIIDTKLDNSGFRKGSAEMKKAMDSLTDTAKELTATVTDAVREMGKATSGAAAETEKASATSTRTLSEVRAELEKTRRKWDELFARQEKALALGDDTDSRGFRALDYDIEQVGERIRVLEEEETRLAAAEAAADAQRVAGIGSLADSAAEASRYADALSEIERATVRETRGMRVWSALKGSVTGALTGIRDGAVKAAQGFAALGQSADGASKKLNVKRVLMYTLGIQSMYSLVRKAKQYFQEGFGNLAKYSAPVKSAMASINGALGTLKGSLATAFAPIYTAAAPALTYLINLLAQAANYVGQLFAALTGQTSYMKAVSTGISNIGSAAGSAAGSAKKLRRELAGFDELNVLSDNSGGGGGGGGSGAGYKFEENPISQAVIGFSDAIKTALEDQFSKIGLIIAGGAAVIGAILTFSGINVPLGIAMMVSGLSAGFAIVAQHWDSMPDELKRIVTIIEGVLGGALLAIGAILTFSGSDIPLGIALMAAGAVTLASAVAVNWNIITEKLKGPIGAIVTLVSGALLALGILAIVGGHIPLGLGLLVAGAAGMATTVSANWNIIKEKLQGPLGIITGIISGALLVLGILLLVAGNIPLGLGLILAGATGLVAAIAPNWDNIVQFGKDVIQCIKDGLLAAWEGITGWLDKHIFQPFMTAFKWLFGINSPSTVMSEQGGFMIEGLLGGMETGMTGIAGWIKKIIVDPILAGLGGLFGFGEKKDKTETYYTVYVKLAKSGWTTVSNWVKEQDKTTPTVSIAAKITTQTRALFSTYLSVWSLSKPTLPMQAKIVTTPKALWDSMATARSALLSRFPVSLNANIVTAAGTFWNNLVTARKALFSNYLVSLNARITTTGAALWNSLATARKTIFSSFAVSLNAQILTNATSLWNGISAVRSALLQKYSVSLNAAIITSAATLWNGLKNARVPLFHSYSVSLNAAIVTSAATLWNGLKTTRSTLFHGFTVSLNAGIITSAATLWNNLAPARSLLLSKFAVSLNASIVSSADALWRSMATTLAQLKKNYTVALSGKIDIDMAASAAALWKKFLDAWNSTKKDLTVTIQAKTSGFDVERTSGGGSTRGGGSGGSFRALGGIIPDGLRGMVKNIPQYARGTLAAHGTMFVAGENGPEIMGHINGKTEILNRSQIAAAMYAATTRALHNVQYRAPAMASGSVLPYAVAAQYARETERLQSTIEASNEDMTQAVISAISSAALAIVGAVQKYSGGSTGSGGPSAQNIIDEINRRTNMFNRSPLKG